MTRSSQGYFAFECRCGVRDPENQRISNEDGFGDALHDECVVVAADEVRGFVEANAVEVVFSQFFEETGGDQDGGLAWSGSDGGCGFRWRGRDGFPAGEPSAVP